MIFLVSMVPIVELRGAIPISQGFQLPLLQSYIICVIGNMLPVPIIYLFARRVLEWGKDKKYIGKFFTFCIEKGHKGGQKLKEKAGNGLFIALLLFVGIPVPGTGAWTGTLAASFLDMGFKKSVLAVLGGVLLAGIVMGAASAGLFSALLQSFKEKYKSGFKFINRTGSSRAWEFLIPEDARYFLPEIKENAKNKKSACNVHKKVYYMKVLLNARCKYAYSYRIWLIGQVVKTSPSHAKTGVDSPISYSVL